MNNIIIENKKVKHNYFIDKTIEAGIVLYGSEVKSIRSLKVSIEESYVINHKNEFYLCNCHISKYNFSATVNYDFVRKRKLLLHKHEIKKIIGKIKIKGYSVVPISMYFNEKNLIKLELAIVIGKKLYDKRHDLKLKDWKKRKNNLMIKR